MAQSLWGWELLNLFQSVCLMLCAASEDILISLPSLSLWMSLVFWKSVIWEFHQSETWILTLSPPMAIENSGHWFPPPCSFFSPTFGLAARFAIWQLWSWLLSLGQLTYLPKCIWNMNIIFFMFQMAQSLWGWELLNLFQSVCLTLTTKLWGCYGPKTYWDDLNLKKWIIYFSSFKWLKVFEAGNFSIFSKVSVLHLPQNFEDVTDLKLIETIWIWKKAL